MKTQFPDLDPTLTEAKKGELKLQKTLLKRACENDFEAIKTMFQQFIPEDEEIYDARYLGIQGFLGFGTHQFACVTNRRIADITVGYFGELTYQDGYLEHIHSVFVYQPNKIILYILIALITAGITIMFQPNSLEMLIIGFLIGVILALIILQLSAKAYYQIFKSGLVLTVREGEFVLYPYANNIFFYTNRLIYIFTDRKLLTRANALYREFIIRREERLNTVENYPLPELKSETETPQLTPLFLSPFPSIDLPENKINFIKNKKIVIGLITAGLGAGGIWAIANFVIPEIQLKRAIDLVNKGNDLQDSKDYESALMAYDQAIKIKVELAEAWIQKCLVLNILEKHKEALYACQEAVIVSPDNYLLWKAKADALLALNLEEKALESYQRATEIKPNYSLAWYHQGLLLKQRGKIDEALNSFNKSLEGDQDLGELKIAEVWGEKCYILTEQRRYNQETFTACDQRVQQVPNDYLAWKERGTVLLELGKKEEALESYKKAIEIKSDYSAAWYNIGAIFRERGELNRALNAMNNAINGDGDFGKMEIANAWEQKCFITLDLDRFQETVEACDQRVQLEPNDSKAWNIKGVALYRLNRLEESLRSFEKAIEIDPFFDLAKTNRDVIRQQIRSQEFL
jgi:tetratricopeptide (TPR) repeat protein